MAEAAEKLDQDMNVQAPTAVLTRQVLLRISEEEYAEYVALAEAADEAVPQVVRKVMASAVGRPELVLDADARVKHNMRMRAASARQKRTEIRAKRAGASG